MPKCTANKITKILINLLLQSSYFAGNSLHCIMDNYQLLKLLETETQAIEFCVRYGLLPDGKPGDCVNCSAKQSCVWAEDKRANGIQFVIKCKICHKSHSIAKNTWFEQSKTSIKNVLLVVYSFLRGFTLNQAALQTGVSRTTVMNWQNFCREVCYLTVSKELRPIGGQGRVVEIDEMLVRKVKLNTSKVWVFGGIDRETKECFAVIINNKNKETILSLINKFIIPGTKIISYKRSVYSNLEEFGYKTEQISTKRKLSDMEYNGKYEIFRAIQPMWAALKKIIKNNGRDSSRNNELYIYQFLYFHRLGLNTAADRFIPFLRDIARSYPGYKSKASSQELKK